MKFKAIKIILLCIIINFFGDIAYAKQPEIPLSVKTLLQICENPKSEACQSVLSISLDAFETTGKLMHSMGNSTSDRTLCFKDNENYQTTYIKIINTIKKKSYAPSTMAFAAVVEVAGDILKCNPPNVFLPMNRGGRSGKNCDDIWYKISKNAKNAKNAAQDAEEAYDDLMQSKSDLESYTLMDNASLMESTRYEYDAALSKYNDYKNDYNSAISDIPECR